MAVLEIFTDGASSGNPGPAGIGVVIREQKKIIKEISTSIGRATNNVAEYKAVLCALEEAKALKAEKLKLSMDSELLYNQLLGRYQVKNEALKALFEEAQKLGKNFKHIELKLIPREQNKEADQLATQAIKREQTKVVASAFDAGEESPSSDG